MSWDAYLKYKQKYGERGSFGGHTHAVPNILRSVLLDGNVKIFEDEKRSVMKTEIWTKLGTVSIFKEYNASNSIWRFKKIEIVSPDNEPLGTIDIFTDIEQRLYPRCRFTVGQMVIGTGAGDIDKVIISRLLDDNSDPRLSAGAEIDPVIIETINKMLQRKTV